MMNDYYELKKKMKKKYYEGTHRLLVCEKKTAVLKKLL